jgi:hypothetical protein
MYTPVENLSPESRIWIYQTSRKLNQQEESTIAETLKSFCDQWAAHGSGLSTSFRIDHHCFVLLAVDEQAGDASGCSIDSSVRVLKELEQKLKLDFFDRSEIAFWHNDEVVKHPLSQLKNLFADGRLNHDSESFNTLAATLGDWNENPRMSVANSWLKRYLPKVSV